MRQGHLLAKETIMAPTLHGTTAQADTTILPRMWGWIEQL